MMTWLLIVCSLSWSEKSCSERGGGVAAMMVTEEQCTAVLRERPGTICISPSGIIVKRTGK